MYIYMTLPGVKTSLKKGQTLEEYLISGGPPKNNRRENVVYMIPCSSCSFCYVGETSPLFDEREREPVQMQHEEL